VYQLLELVVASFSINISPLLIRPQLISMTDRLAAVLSPQPAVRPNNSVGEIHYIRTGNCSRVSTKFTFFKEELARIQVKNAANFITTFDLIFTTI